MEGTGNVGVATEEIFFDFQLRKGGRKWRKSQKMP
jgi:hypothetical protein